MEIRGASSSDTRAAEQLSVRDVDEYSPVRQCSFSVRGLVCTDTDGHVPNLSTVCC